MTVMICSSTVHVTEPERKRRKVDRKSQNRENPFVFVETTDPHWTSIR